MAEQEMLLDSATIKAAVAGEKWATEKVIQHYTPMIDVLAVDEDMKQHLILKLLEELPHFPMGQQRQNKVLLHIFVNGQHVDHRGVVLDHLFRGPLLTCNGGLDRGAVQQHFLFGHPLNTPVIVLL